MRKLLGLSAALAAAGVSCTTLPTPKFTNYALPKKGVYIEAVDRPHRVIGMVRTKVDFPSLDEARDEQSLCRNYYNKAVSDLLERARKQGADAIMEVRSVVFMEDGSQEIYKTPECADDGQEGQILAQAKAVKWLRTKSAEAEATTFTPAGEEPPAPRKPRRVIRREPVPQDVQRMPLPGGESADSADQDPVIRSGGPSAPAGSPLSSPLGK